MLLPQIPADWAALVGPINQLNEDLKVMGDRLRILTNYVDVLEKRVKDLEGRAQKSRNSESARKAYRKKTHWATIAKRNFDLLKESRKREGKPTKTHFTGMKLWRQITHYMKANDQEKIKMEEQIWK